MAQVFYAVESELVDASAHGNGYQYRVAFGYENWDGDKVPVCKVQIVNPNGKVLGLQAPSYPTQKEYDEVQEVLEKLVRKHIPKSNRKSG